MRASKSQLEHQQILNLNELEEPDKNVEKLEKQEEFMSSDSAHEILKEKYGLMNEKADVESQEKELSECDGVEANIQSTPHLDLQKRPFSVRTRHVRTHWIEVLTGNH